MGWISFRFGCGFAALIAIVAIESCYQSDEYRNGIVVEVLVEAPSSSFVVGELRPARGARVIGQRCSDGETAEARVGSDGLAWIDLPYARCLTITAVRPDGESVISLVRVKPPIEAPIVFRSATYYGALSDYDSVNVEGTIEGRSSPGSTVTIEAPPLMFRSVDGRTSRLHTNFDTFRATDASRVPSDSTSLFAIEWDSFGQPVNAFETTLSIDRDRPTTVVVSFPSPPIAMDTRVDIVEIPKGGAVSFDGLNVLGGYAFRASREGGAFLAGSSRAVLVAESTRSRMYELTTLEPAIAWPPELEPIRGAALSHDTTLPTLDIAGAMTLPEEPGAIRIPPIESAELAVESFDSPRIRVGGRGHIGFVAIANGQSSFGIRWEIYGDRDAILVLDEWPILPSGIAWRDLDFEAGDRVTVSTGVKSSEDQTMWGGVIHNVPQSGWELFVDQTYVEVGP